MAEQNYYRRKLRIDFLRELEESDDSTSLGASAVFFSMVDTGLEGTIETEPPLDLPLRNNLPLDEAEQLPEAQELATEELVAGHVPPAQSALATA